MAVRALSAVLLFVATIAAAGESNEQKDATNLLHQGLTALESGEFDKAEGYLSRLQRHYGTVTWEDDDEGTTFGYQAKRALTEVKCLKQWESKDKSPQRTEVETLNQVIAAIGAHDAVALRPLISCGILEGVPESELGSTNPDETVLRLLGKKGGDGLAPAATPKGYKILKIAHPIGFLGVGNNKAWILTSGKSYLEVVIGSAKYAPKTSRVLDIVWGEKGDSK